MGAGRAGGGHSGGGHSGGGRSSSSGGHSGGGSSSFGGGHAGGGRSSGSGGSSGGFFGSKPSRSEHKSGGIIFGSKPRREEPSSGSGFFSDTKPPERTTIINNTYYGDSDDTNDSYDDSNNSSTSRSYNNDSSSRGGCLKGCIIFALLFIFAIGFCLFLDISNDEDSSSEISTSTIVREALPAGTVNETEYYTDEIGWISDQEELEKGMKKFYEKTGVQPYLYITNQDVYGQSVTDPEELADYAEELYQNLFTDEGHFLLVFFSSYDVDYVDYYICGYDAEEVIDSEVADILLDYLDDAFYDQMAEYMTHEEYFSNAFDKTAAQITAATESPEVQTVKEPEQNTIKEEPKQDTQTPLIGIIIVVLLIGFFILLSKHMKRKKKKAEQDLKILETPLEKFGDSELEALEKKYEEM